MANLLGQNIGTNYKGILNLNTLNGNLTTTLEAITDGDGNASSLQLSTTQASIVANRNYNTLHIGGSAAVGMKITQSSDSSTDGILFGFNGANGSYASIGNGSSLIMTTSAFSFHRTNYNSLIHANVFVGAGNLTPTISARLHVRGDGTNPIARFEDNAGNAAMSVENSRTVTIFTNISTPAINVRGTEITVGGGGGGGNTGSQFNISALGAATFTSGTGGAFGISQSITMGAGSGNWRAANIAYTINNSGAQTGTATGIFLNATETALNGMGHNLMDLQVNGGSRFSVSRLGALTAEGITSNSNIIAAGTASYQWLGRSRMNSPSDGVITLFNNGSTDFNRLQLGGTTKPSICQGAGTPEGAVTAPVGSIFMRSDGGAGTSFYVKESGTGNTGWVAK